jgi:hypothetical protein
MRARDTGANLEPNARIEQAGSLSSTIIPPMPRFPIMESPILQDGGSAAFDGRPKGCAFTVVANAADMAQLTWLFICGMLEREAHQHYRSAGSVGFHLVTLLARLGSALRTQNELTVSNAHRAARSDVSLNPCTADQTS